MDYTLFVITYRKNKVTCHCQLDFPLSDFLRLFIISFKYGPILLRYSSTDSALFLSPLVYIQYNFYSKSYLLLLVYNNFLVLLHVPEDS